MKLLIAFISLAFLPVLTSAVPVSGSDIVAAGDVVSEGNAPSALEARNVSSWAPNHGAPYCAGQGPGSCNLAWYYREMGHVEHLEVVVYNRFCREIGSLEQAFPMDNNPTWGGGVWNNLDSELPYVVVYNWASPSGRLFRYGRGTFHEDHHADFDHNDEGAWGNNGYVRAAEIHQCPFNCGTGHWNL